MPIATTTMEDLTGRTMGGCRLLRRIGKGAMGAVYLAEQVELSRQVAFKVLDTKFSADASYIERFEREARAIAALNHKNIVKVYDCGRDGDFHFIVNEFVDGGTVQSLIDEKCSLSSEETVEYAIQVAEGLAAAAAANIIHRDIKPDNLMLTRAGVLKIADFGLAKTIAPGQASSESGLIMGTPFYMSPEQAKGLPMDSRSDIYSLGVSMYCMVIGDVPFDADSVVGVLLKQISADRPDPCAVKPSLPSVLGSLVMRMMDKSPENRPQNPQELLRELEAVRQILKPAAPPPSLAEVSELSEDKRQNFRPLPRERILRVTRVEASGDVLTRIITSIQDDSGVVIEAAEPFPPNTVVEVRFIDSEKDAEMSGLGLVRWTDTAVMGVTFVKVQPIVRGSTTAMRLSGPMAIVPLTATPLHQRLLRLVYTNAGQLTTLSKIAGSLGVGVKMAEEPVRTFERASLIKRRDNGQLEYLWPKDESLQKEIVMWIERNGLR